MDALAGRKVHLAAGDAEETVELVELGHVAIDAERRDGAVIGVVSDDLGLAQVAHPGVGEGTEELAAHP